MNQYIYTLHYGDQIFYIGRLKSTRLHQPQQVIDGFTKKSYGLIKPGKTSETTPVLAFIGDIDRADWLERGFLRVEGTAKDALQATLRMKDMIQAIPDEANHILPSKVSFENRLKRAMTEDDKPQPADSPLVAFKAKKGDIFKPSPDIFDKVYRSLVNNAQLTKYLEDFRAEVRGEFEQLNKKLDALVLLNQSTGNGATEITADEAIDLRSAAMEVVARDRAAQEYNPTQSKAEVIKSSMNPHERMVDSSWKD